MHVRNSHLLLRRLLKQIVLEAYLTQEHSIRMYQGYFSASSYGVVDWLQNDSQKVSTPLQWTAFQIKTHPPPLSTVVTICLSWKPCYTVEKHIFLQLNK